jgi:hypothetical protein
VRGCWSGKGRRFKEKGDKVETSRSWREKRCLRRRKHCGGLVMGRKEGDQKAGVGSGQPITKYYIVVLKRVL